MLKRFLSIALALVGFASLSCASIVLMEHDDVGDSAMKRDIRREMYKSENATGSAFRQQSTKLQDFKKGFVGLQENEIIALFGPKVEKKPNTFALPIYDSGWLVFPGLFDSSEPDKAHADFYEIDDFAGARVFYDRSGVRVRGILFYFRVDGTFPKLKGWNDLKARLEWENSRFATLEMRMAERRKTLACGGGTSFNRPQSLPPGDPDHPPCS
jgi:hypothetical protein